MEKYLDQIITLVGVHGFFAMLASIMTVRFITIGWNPGKRVKIICMVICSSALGAACVYYFTDAVTFKALSSGAFVCVFGTPMLYELLKFITTLAYEKTKLNTFKAMYFFLTPKPLKIVRKQDGKKTVVYEPPHEDLTQMMDWKRKKPEPDEHGEGLGSNHFAEDDKSVDNK